MIEKQAKPDATVGRKQTQKETKKWSNDDVALLIDLWKKELACGMFMTNHTILNTQGKGLCMR